MRKTPKFEECFAELISLPSVSSIDPAHDMSNRNVIDALANCFDALGFACEIMPVSDNPQKCNLIATRGEGQDQSDNNNNSGIVLSESEKYIVEPITTFVLPLRPFSYVP